MKIQFIFLFIIFFQFSYSQADDLNENKRANVNRMIMIFQKLDKDEIVKMINYPLRRDYPIPFVKNEKEMMIRFDEVFDYNLVKKISTSQVNQWNEVGWRGIMLDNGVIWIDSDKGFIIAVNYQSNFEKNLKEKLIAEQKDNLHPSLKDFVRPVYKIQTKDYLIRIDELSSDKYRYASWKIGAKESSKPDIVLTNGESEFSGSGGNSVTTFRNGVYTYKIFDNVVREEGAKEVSLEIEKNGKRILWQEGNSIQ